MLIFSVKSEKYINSIPEIFNFIRIEDHNTTKFFINIKIKYGVRIYLNLISKTLLCIHFFEYIL